MNNRAEGLARSDSGTWASCFAHEKGLLSLAIWVSLLERGRCPLFITGKPALQNAHRFSETRVSAEAMTAGAGGDIIHEPVPYLG